MILIGTKVFDGDGSEYAVERLLNSGGFGQVFLVKRGEYQLALKVAHSVGMTPAEFESLKDEAALAIGLDHENVIKVHYFHDGSKHQGLEPYLLMDYADGGSLAEYLNSQKKNGGTHIPVPELRSILTQVMDGMRAINEKLIHRDFHPGNALFKSGVLKITDFGLSKLVDAATRTQTFKGVQHMFYKPPESWRGAKDQIQMDMYSVGVTLYELATLHYPYQFPGKKDQIIELMEAHLYAPLRATPVALNPALPKPMSELIIKLLRKDPGERFKTWNEAFAELQKDGAVQAPAVNISALVAKARATCLSG